MTLLPPRSPARSKASSVWQGRPAHKKFKAATAARKHQLDWAKQAHDLEEAIKDNERRRQEESQNTAHRRRMELGAFCFLLVVAGGALVAGFLLAVMSKDAVARTFGQALTTTVVGGVMGGFAGYLTGRSTK